MEYIYAALTLNESGESITEDAVTEVLEAAGVDVEDSRVKALVAALEDVDIEEAIDTAAAAPAPAAGAGAASEAEVEDEADTDEEEPDETEEEEADEADDEDDEASGEGLGNLFG
ncbi:50S ribosomal protein P1 [Haloquadratum walsbyi]|jgi:large subunit ribosomal protein L12|uniref:Large ribosomal subunit protein P1 n=3 Tax=Haloquadratum walsbyi TaxID=293091 RepID=Q18G92_HALWD|nr:50S ribosomal protein P1 [Haloquadratum walsbyi]CAJ53008.1 50S ribosomal protein L12 [Haloquadratum walsbyi DSM 16790]CCC41078.1 50S ribosomal protein L12 [Haloquadratum walsbyi C23]